MQGILVKDSLPPSLAQFFIGGVEASSHFTLFPKETSVKMPMTLDLHDRMRFEKLTLMCKSIKHTNNMTVCD